MSKILSFERFSSQQKDLWAKYQQLLQQYPEDKRLKKAKRTLKLVRGAYGREKIYAVKYLRLIEQHLPFFSGGRRSVFVGYMELLQKVILEKKVSRTP